MYNWKKHTKKVFFEVWRFQKYLYVFLLRRLVNCRLHGVINFTTIYIIAYVRTYCNSFLIFFHIICKYFFMLLLESFTINFFVIIFWRSFFNFCDWFFDWFFWHSFLRFLKLIFEIDFWFFVILPFYFLTIFAPFPDFIFWFFAIVFLTIFLCVFLHFLALFFVPFFDWFFESIFDVFCCQFDNFNFIFSKKPHATNRRRWHAIFDFFDFLIFIF